MIYLNDFAKYDYARLGSFVDGCYCTSYEQVQIMVFDTDGNKKQQVIDWVK